MSYLDKTQKQTACIVKSVFHTEYGLNKISSSFAGSDENEPSDLVSTSESVFPAEFGYTSAPPTWHQLWFLRHARCSFNFKLQFYKQVLKHISHSAPITVEGGGKRLAKGGTGLISLTEAWKWQGAEHNGQQKTQRITISCTTNSIAPLISRPPESTSRTLTERSDGMAREVGRESRRVFILGDWSMVIR